MPGSYSGVRVGFYLLMVVGVLLFLVTQVMAAGNPMPGLTLEDCEWFRQSGQQVIETANQTQDMLGGDTSGQIGLGGGGAPADWPRGDTRVWEMAVASGECPAGNAG